MKSISVLLSLFVFAPNVWSDVTVIYRKSDKLVVGYVFPPMSVQTELQNTVQSELKGVKEDYATAVVDDATWKANRGKQPLIAPDGTVSFQEDPASVARKQRQQVAQAALALKGVNLQDLKDALGQ